MRFNWLYSLQTEDNLKSYSRNPPGKLSVPRLLRQLPAFEQHHVGLVPKPRPLIINIHSTNLDPVAVKRKIVELMQEGHSVRIPVVTLGDETLPVHLRYNGAVHLKTLDEEWIESGVIDFSSAAHRPWHPSYSNDSGVFDDSYVLTHYDMECLLADDPRLAISTVNAADFFWLDGSTGLYKLDPERRVNVHWKRQCDLLKEWEWTHHPHFSKVIPRQMDHIIRTMNVIALAPTWPAVDASSPILMRQNYDDREQAKTTHITTRVRCRFFHSDFIWKIGAQKHSDFIFSDQQARDALIYTPGSRHPVSNPDAEGHYEYDADFQAAILRDDDIRSLLQGEPLRRVPIDFTPDHLANLTAFGYILPIKPGLQTPRPHDRNQYESNDAFLAAIRAYEAEYKDTPLIRYENEPNIGPDAADVVALLAHTPNLQQLMLGRMAHPNRDWPNLPALNTLTVGFATNTTSLFTLLTRAENLEVLRLHHALAPDGSIALPPLPSIKRFYQEGVYDENKSIHPGTLSVLLQAMPNLEHISLSFKKTGDWRMPHMSNLTSMAIYGDLPGNLNMLLSDNPQLQKLDLSEMTMPLRDFNERDRQQLIETLQRCPQLTRIRINYIDPDNTALLNYWKTVLDYAPWLDEKTVAHLRRRTNPEKSKKILDNFFANFGDLFSFTGNAGSSNASSSGFGGFGFNVFGGSSGASSSSGHRDPDANHHAPTSRNTSFQASDMQTHEPEATGKPFAYAGGHQALNQTMVIDQYCRYLQLQGEAIPDIVHGGICNALSHLCAKKGPAKWQRTLVMLRDWNGEASMLTRKHRAAFNEIRNYIATYQQPSVSGFLTRLVNRQTTNTWLGEQAVNWLRNQDPGETFILSNPWHAIYVKREQIEGEPPFFVAYNPSFVEGSILRVNDEHMASFLRQALGDINLVSVEGFREVNNLTLSDPVSFLANGGLWQMVDAGDQDRLADLLEATALPDTSDALKGLFLRSLDGVPFWYFALKINNERLKNVSLTLLARFMQQHPDTWWVALDTSYSSVKNPGFAKALQNVYDAFENVNLPSSDLRDAVSEIPHVIAALLMKQDDVASMQPSSNAPQNQTLDDKLNALSRSEQPSHLVTVQAPEHVRMTRFALEERARSEGRTVIYINSPSDLTLSNPFVQLQPDQRTGHFSDGPGGHVFDALTTAERPLIIVNYDAFPPAARVRFNTLFDDEPQADGVPLPKGSTVVALQNAQNSASYKGSDMSSRFSQRDIWLERTQDYPPLPFIPEHRTDDAEDEVVIDLFEGADWKERLLGSWSPRGDSLVLTDSLLVQALRRSHKICIRNAPRNDPEYHDFWHDAAAQRSVFPETGRVDLPESFSLREEAGYNWPALADRIVSLGRGLDLNCENILNSSTLEDFLTHYTCDDASETLSADENYLETRFGRNGQITLNVTQTVCRGSLARFLTVCKDLNITLNLHLAENVDFPQELVPVERAEEQPVIPTREHTRLILSDDPDTSCAQERTANTLVIDVSECEAGHLINTIDGFLERKPARLRSKNHTGLLPKHLTGDRTVILTGTFSTDVAETLTPLLLERYRQDNANSKLVLIPHNKDTVPLGFLPAEQRLVTTAEKQAYFPDNNFDDQTLQEHSLAQLDAMVRCERSNGAGNNQSAWAGLHRLDVQLESRDFDATNSKQIANDFDAARLDAIDNKLRHSPIAVITGLTGVGKSSTMKGVYAKRHPHIHYGAQDSIVRAWATDSSQVGEDDFITLFIDEANTSGNNWSAFEGLYENPAFVRIGRDILYLTPQHRVVFACNPVNYGDRNLPSLFERRGSALVFDPMPREYIYKRMLKPLLKQPIPSRAASHIAPDMIPVIAHEFLEVYRFLCECSETSVLITPRELIMMARMTRAHQNRNNDPKDVARHYARHYARLLTKDLVPPKHRQAFDRAFPPVELDMRTYTTPSNAAASSSDSTPQRPRFLVTDSRKPLANLIHDLLDLQIMVRDLNPDDTNKDFLSGGLGGLIIEGAPGQGKSELVRHMAEQLGYREGNPARPLVIIPASMNEDRKRKTLLKAFDDGALVIMDEINSSPMMEDLLNDLLMGERPKQEQHQAGEPDLDQAGKPGHRHARKPGFFLVGTQNPASMGGRQKLSNALMRRVISYKLPDYNKDEMMAVLQTCPVPHVPVRLSRIHALQLVNLYQEHKNQGVTFRDILKRARTILQIENPDLHIPEYDDELDIERLPAARPVPEALQPLFDAINKLQAQGEDMQNPLRHSDPGAAAMGEATVALAVRLRARAWEFTDNPAAYRDSFNTELTEGFAASATHRNILYPILYLIGQFFKATLSFGIAVGLEGRHGFFTAKTERQKLIEKITSAVVQVPNQAHAAPDEPEAPTAAASA